MGSFRVPSDRLERLGIRPKEEWPFVLADGREALIGIAWIRIRIAGREEPATPRVRARPAVVAPLPRPYEEATREEATRPPP